MPKIKIFLFGAYEGVRKEASNPIVNQVTISDAVRNGQVTNLSTGAVISRQSPRLSDRIWLFIQNPRMGRQRACQSRWPAP